MNNRNYIRLICLTIFSMTTMVVHAQELSLSNHLSDTWRLKHASADTLIVAYGKLLESNVDFFGDSGKWPDSAVGISTFKIEGVERGSLSTNIIRVVYYASTLHGQLPKNAILLLSGFSDYKGTYSVVGKEAWRGILPDTPENRKRIADRTADELAKTLKGNELQKSTAIDVAIQAIINHGDYTGKVKFYPVRKQNFGWLMVAYVLDETNDKTIIRQFKIKVSNTGEVTAYGPNILGSNITVADWNDLPNF